MSGQHLVHRPSLKPRQPVNPFSEMFRPTVHPGALTQGNSPTHPHHHYAQAYSYNHDITCHYETQPKPNPSHGLVRTYSLKMENNSSFVEFNQGSRVQSPNRLDKHPPLLKFLGKDTFGKSFVNTNPHRDLFPSRLEGSKVGIHNEENKNQKETEETGIDKQKMKSELKWSPKRKKSKKSDDLGSFNRNVLADTKLMEVIHPPSDKFRRSSNHQMPQPAANTLIPSPTSSPNSEGGKIIKRGFSHTTLTFTSQGEGDECKMKHFEVATEPSSPLNQRIELRPPRKEDFWVGKSLGKGRFGDVYLVKHKGIGFVCGMKMMSKKTILKENFVNQFCREVTIQMYLQHRNVTSLYGVFDDEEYVYLLLEPCLDSTLYKYMKLHRQIPQEEVVSLTQQICDGVEFLHGARIIHRDLKPQNIIMHESLLKICDFGWAVYNKDSLRDTFCGTPLFLSPQMLRGDTYCEKIDIWAIGMICYEMLVGRPPFRIKSQLQLEKILHEEIQFPEHHKITEVAKDFILCLLDRNEESRLDVESALSHPFFSDLDRF